jgi:hypothetical protein
MSQPEIQQHDAKRLAAGYKKSFRLVEILAILTFWGLSLGIAVKAWPFHTTHPWVIVAGLVAGFLGYQGAHRATRRPLGNARLCLPHPAR